MDQIERCIEEQRRAAEFIRLNPKAPADQLAGARMAVADWLMEETLLRLEEKRG